MNEKIDAITLEILSNKLLAIADEAAMVLKRTSFSTVLRESNDFALILLDRDGNSLCHGTLSVATFSGMAAMTTKWFLREKGADWFEEGDVVITNDPWLACAHKPDIIALTPVFHRGALVGFVGSSGHIADIGGLGYSANSQSLFEEGLGIPPMKLLTAAGYNEDLLAIIRDNVRIPDEVIGDINAEVSAGRLAARRMTELLEERHLENFQEIGALFDRAERSMRRAISEVPDGTYHHEVTIDGVDVPVTIAVTVIVDGDEIEVDFAGTSPESNWGINSVSNYTTSMASYTLKCLLNPLTPKNEGSFRPFREMRIPEGSVLNPRRPAPVTGRSLTGHIVVSAMLGALAPAIPDLVIADSGSCPGIRPGFSGFDHGVPFSFLLFANGGMGARAHEDGLLCTGFPTNAGCASMEVMESIAPLRCLKHQLREDSGGAGRSRGGLGQEVVVEYVADSPGMLSMYSERKEHPALGLFGGGHGARTEALLNDVEAPQKGRVSLKLGDQLVMRYPGGGGYGDPLERDRRLVQRDVDYGYVSREVAESVYGLTVGAAESAL